MSQRSKFQEWRYQHDEAWLSVKIIVVLFIIGVPLVSYTVYAIEMENTKYKAGIETLSCPEIKFLIQYGDFEHHGNEMILDVWVDKC